MGLVGVVVVWTGCRFAARKQSCKSEEDDELQQNRVIEQEVDADADALMLGG